uniref:Uncharacterized protein n=1 Tax=Arcella intermedia TaxID=1963864 RepID=A0A6B2LSR5_9EUKA
MRGYKILIQHCTQLDKRTTLEEHSNILLSKSRATKIMAKLKEEITLRKSEKLTLSKYLSESSGLMNLYLSWTCLLLIPLHSTLID